MASVNSEGQVYQRISIGTSKTSEERSASFNGRQATETKGIAYIKQCLQNFAGWLRDLPGRIKDFFITHCRCCTCDPDETLLLGNPAGNEETDMQSLSARGSSDNGTEAEVIVYAVENTSGPATADATKDMEPTTGPDCMSQLPRNEEQTPPSIASDIADAPLSPLPPDTDILRSKEVTLPMYHSCYDSTVPVTKADTDDETRSLDATIKTSPAPTPPPSLKQDPDSDITEPMTNSAAGMTSLCPLSDTCVELDKLKDMVQSDDELAQPLRSPVEAIDSTSASNTEDQRQTSLDTEYQRANAQLAPMWVMDEKTREVMSNSTEQEELTGKRPNQASESQNILEATLVSLPHADPEDKMDAENHSEKTVVSEQHSQDGIWKDFDTTPSIPYHSRPFHSLTETALKRHTLPHAHQRLMSYSSAPNLSELSDNANESRLYEPLSWSDNEEDVSSDTETEDDLDGADACSSFYTSEDVEKTLSDSSREDDISDAATGSTLHTSTNTEAIPSTSQHRSKTLTRESPEYETILKFLIYAANLSGRTKHDKANQIALKEILKIHPFSSSKLKKSKGRRIKSKHIRTLREDPAAFLSLCRFIVCSRNPLGYAAKNLTLYRELAAGHTVTLEEANRRFPIEAPNIPDPNDPEKTIPDIETTKKIQAIMIPVRKRVLEISPDLQAKDLSNSQQLVELIIYEKIVAAYFLFLDQIIEEEPRVQSKKPNKKFRPFSKPKEVEDPENPPHLNVKAIKDFVECEWEKKQLELLLKNEELSDQQILDCIKRTNTLIEDIEQKLEKYDDNELPPNFKAICRGDAAKEELDGATTIPELKRKLLKVFQDRAIARSIVFE